jgi:hypothetical protein
MLHKNGHIRFVEPLDNLWSEEEGDGDGSVKDGVDSEDGVSKMGGWTCEIAAIKEAHYTSNVVDMMVDNFRKLSQKYSFLPYFYFI